VSGDHVCPTNGQCHHVGAGLNGRSEARSSEASEETFLELPDYSV
jgi:hypothetical protein